jgi:hypothetical protein
VFLFRWSISKGSEKRTSYNVIEYIKRKIFEEAEMHGLMRSGFSGIL